MGITYIAPYWHYVETTPPYNDYIVALLHFDGTPGATTTSDTSALGLTWTATGSAAISATQGKFGTTSANMNAGRFVSADRAEYEVGAGYWTLEAWVYAGTLTGYRDIFSKRSTTSEYSPFLLRTNNATVEFFCSTTGSAWNYSDTSAGTLTTGTWHHVALQRRYDSGANDIIEVFIDGVVTGSAAIPTGQGLLNNTLPLAVGGAGPSGYWGNGNYVDEFRFINGIARYTDGNFTPPTAAFDDP